MVDFIVFLFTVALVGGIVAYAVHEDEIHPPVCLETTKVVSIDSIHFRGATVTMGNGQTYELYQATLKPGDDFCLNWKKY